MEWSFHLQWRQIPKSGILRMPRTANELPALELSRLVSIY